MPEVSGFEEELIPGVVVPTQTRAQLRLSGESTVPLDLQLGIKGYKFVLQVSYILDDPFSYSISDSQYTIEHRRC